MPHYTTTQEFGPYNNVCSDRTALLVVDAGTGSIDLQVDSNGQWITSESFTADAVKRVMTGGALWRVNVTGNASYVWEG